MVGEAVCGGGVSVSRRSPAYKSKEQHGFGKFRRIQMIFVDSSWFVEDQNRGFVTNMAYPAHFMMAVKRWVLLRTLATTSVRLEEQNSARGNSFRLRTFCIFRHTKKRTSSQFEVRGRSDERKRKWGEAWACPFVGETLRSLPLK